MKSRRDIIKVVPSYLATTVMVLLFLHIFLSGIFSGAPVENSFSDKKICTITLNCDDDHRDDILDSRTQNLFSTLTSSSKEASRFSSADIFEGKRNIIPALVSKISVYQAKIFPRKIIIQIRTLRI